MSCSRARLPRMTTSVQATVPARLRQTPSYTDWRRMWFYYACVPWVSLPLSSPPRHLSHLFFSVSTASSHFHLHAPLSSPSLSLISLLPPHLHRLFVPSSSAHSSRTHFSPSLNVYHDLSLILFSPPLSVPPAHLSSPSRRSSLSHNRPLALHHLHHHLTLLIAHPSPLPSPPRTSFTSAASPPPLLPCVVQSHCRGRSLICFAIIAEDEGWRGRRCASRT